MAPARSPLENWARSLLSSPPAQSRLLARHWWRRSRRRKANVSLLSSSDCRQLKNCSCRVSGDHWSPYFSTKALSRLWDVGNNTASQWACPSSVLKMKSTPCWG